jgi:hypothetical protein
LFIYFIFPPALTFSQTNWYVDNNASGSNNGTNWTNAWKSLNNINWNSISGGDTIFISGGTDSTVYNETLIIDQSGNSADRIVITKGLSTGHNGKVVIDGQNSRDYCVDFNYSQYITLSYIKCANAATTEIRMRASNCTISHCEIYHTEGIMSLDMYDGSNNIIEYVTADESPTPVAGSFGGNGDFMQCSGGGNNVFRYNNITLRDEVTGDHTDALQFYFSNNPNETPINGGTWEIYGNIIRHTDTKIYNAQGIYIEGLDRGILDNTNWYIYDNLIILPYAFDGIAIRNNNLKAYIYNNTIYQGSGAASAGFWIYSKFSSSIDSVIVKNNVFYSASKKLHPINIGIKLNAGSDISNNLIFSPKDSPIKYLNNELSLSLWNSLSFVGTDFSGDPLFNNISTYDFTLHPNSPAINTGVNLGSQFNLDILGRQRRQTGNWDIGCYLWTMNKHE